MKYEFIEAHTDEHSVVKMCKVLGVSKSGFYKWKGKHLQGETEREKKKAEIKQMICKSYHENYGTYGSRGSMMILLSGGIMYLRKQ
ncbi:hypothetical protein I7V34_07545 [Bacillus sp. V3]|nr:hypothetical protein I7V34_07545 [Bacillus sp. V3]